VEEMETNSDVMSSAFRTARQQLVSLVFSFIELKQIFLSVFVTVKVT